MAEHKLEFENRDVQKSFQEAGSAATDAYKTGIDLFRRGMERTITVQKQMLDAASQQNAEAAETWRRMYGSIPGAEPLFTLTEQTVGNFIDLRKRFLDIIEGQSDELAGSAKRHAEQTERAAHEMASHRERQKTA